MSEEAFAVLWPRLENQVVHYLRRQHVAEGVFGGVVSFDLASNGNPYATVQIGAGHFTVWDGQLITRLSDERLVGSTLVAVWCDSNPPRGHRNVTAIVSPRAARRA